MGMTKGWKAHTWYRVQELETDPSRLFTGITKEFLRGIEHAKAKERTYQELQASRNEIDTPALRRVDEVGGNQVAAGATPKVIGQ